VTSAAPDEGKSTIAVNLAVALSMGGAAVLLMDADVRRGHLHEVVGLSGARGLSDCIREAGRLDEFVLRSALPNLFLLPRGKQTSASSELFLSSNFDQLINEAKAQFEYIVIDTTPVFAADDATTLAPKADAVLFVVRSAFTSTRQAQEALELLYQRQAKIFGLVLNRANAKSRSYQYYKYEQYHATSNGA
jgi:capsular exopolysaccharide synthesis family protein